MGIFNKAAAGTTTAPAATAPAKHGFVGFVLKHKVSAKGTHYWRVSYSDGQNFSRVKVGNKVLVGYQSKSNPDNLTLVLQDDRPMNQQSEVQFTDCLSSMVESR